MIFDGIESNALENKIILITGAGSGIGRAAAISFANHGARVILLGKTIKKLESVYDEIMTSGGLQPAIIPLDLKGATEQNYQDMADTIKQEYGQLDGLLFNASLIGVLSPIEHIDMTTYNDVMQVNMTSQLMITKALLPLLKLSPSASIIHTSSSVGRQGRAYWGAYAISKFATEGLMQVLAHECEGSRIRVNSINPGATRTAMRASAYPAEDPMTLKTPEQIMSAYLYLMSDKSKEANGQQINAQ